jgi:hypothetical protein
MTSATFSVRLEVDRNFLNRSTKMLDLKDFYILWAGNLNMGDTPGVFNYAQFAGLILQIPVTITYPDEGLDTADFLLRTTDVEIYNGAKHPIYWDWQPGTPFDTPVGYIDDTDPVSDQPEYHLARIQGPVAKKGRHTITIVINQESDVGLKDDFVVEWLGANQMLGAKIGW